MEARFDAEDVSDAAEAVLRAGERLDVGLFFGRPGASVDARVVASVLASTVGRVVIELPDSGPAVILAPGVRLELEVTR